MIELSTLGEIDILSYFVNKSTPEDIKLKLFVNDMVPQKDYTIQNFIELSQGFYDDVSLIPANWEYHLAELEGKPTNVLIYPTVMFNVRSFVGTIYGYYGVGTRTGALKFYSAFAEPIKCSTEGADIKASLTLIINR